MPEVLIEDFKLRLFVDTNVLIDAFVTPDEPVVDFLNKAKEHEDIDLVTSDYALWEQNEFIRMQTWIKILLAAGKSHKTAVKYGVKVTTAIQEEVTNNITKSLEARESYNILNYNLMDEAISSKDFFALTEKLTAFTAISSKDLLILLSAYATRANAILSRDKNFGNEFTNAISMKESLKDSLLPEPLKSLRFYKPHTDPQTIYFKWFTDVLKPKRLANCESKIYEQQSVICIKCEGDNIVKVGDYLMIVKVSKDFFRKEIVKVTEGNIKDYTSLEDVKECNHLTLKINSEPNTIGWMANGFVFKILDPTS